MLSGLTFDEAPVLDDANAELLRALERTGLEELLEEPQDLWGHQQGKAGKLVSGLIPIDETA